MLVKCIIYDTSEDPIDPTGEKTRTYTTVQKLVSPRLHLFDQKYSKNCNIMWHYYNLKELFCIQL